MSLARHIREQAKVRAERDAAIEERDAARRVIAELTDKLGSALTQLGTATANLHLTRVERDAFEAALDELDAAHRAAIADLDAIIGAANYQAKVIAYHPEPDIDRAG